MKVLGLSSNYHDASAAIICDGEVVAAAAEERYSRQKHDPTFPVHSVRYCLRAAGIKGHELDLVSYHEETATKLTRTISTSISRWPRSLPAFMKTASEFVSGGSWIQNSISRELGIDPTRVVFAPHHMSHAAHAFLGSGYEEAAVMTIDAVGEWISSAIFRASNRNGRVHLEPLAVSPFPHSLGLAYSAFTSYLGFKVNDGECSTMALAAFGEPRYAEEVRRIIRVRPDGGHEVDLSYFDFRSDTELPMTRRFLELFGPPRPYKQRLSFDCLGFSQGVPGAEEKRFADIAASLQQVLQEAVLAYAARAARLTGSKRLCYAGGVALNCVANAGLLESGIFEDVFIPPDPGDGGGALGAALYAYSTRARDVPVRRISPWLGEAFGDSELDAFEGRLDPMRWHHFTRLKVPALRKENLRWTRFPGTEQLCSAVTERILAGSSVGWMQGRFENGPRALGNRSILLRPDNPALACSLSATVKLRAGFRPYALSITEEEARRSLVLTQGKIPCALRWMQSAVKVKEVARDAFRSALHIDGTTRVQVVNAQENPLFHALLRKVGEATGHEGLLNTSFNESGYPIVATPVDGLITMARTALEVLVVGHRMVEKVGPS
jgi:carbamoyltransferase